MLAGALLAGLGGLPIEAQQLAPGCAPEKLTKMVTSLYYPGLDPQSFASQPKTLWRWGEKLARLEEGLNPSTQQQLLAVIHEPDIWIADRKSGKGRHMIDPGPIFAARLPVFAELTEGIWPGLELGCELLFFRVHGATVLPDESGTTYLLREGDLRVRLRVDAHDRPVRIEAERGALKRGVEFLSYEVMSQADPKLFERPEGIAYEEPAPNPPKMDAQPAPEPAPPTPPGRRLGVALR